MQPGQHNQQLQPFGGGSTSAHSSPMKRAPQAVSPLASPMESRRVFMAHQQQHSGEQQQQQQPPMGISALQLGYAMPACRLLVDPQTGQQYFVPTAAAPAPHGMPSAAPTAAYFQPALFYNQPTAAFYPAHHQPHHPSVVTTSSPGYFYGAHQPPPVSSAAGYFAHQMNMNSAMQQQYQQQPTVPHHQMPPSSAYRSQSPMGREGQGQAYRVEVPPSTVDGGSIYGEGGGVDERDSLRDGGYGQQQQQQFHRREQCRLSTESRGSSTRGGGGGAGMFDGSPGETHSNPEECSHYGTAYYAARSPPPPPHHHQQLKQMPLPPPPLLLGQQQMTLSPGGGSSSESTSGFASGGRSRTRTFGDEPRSPQPPQSPLREQRGMFFPSQQHFRGEEEKHGREEQQMRRSPPPQPQQPRRAIRMDIDLSRPMSPPESASATRAMGGGGQKQLRNNGNGAESTAALSVRATVLRTAPPTAFTISFNDDSHSRPSPSADQAHQLGQVSISEVSLQEAAKQAPKGRRMMLARRSVPPRGQSGAGHDSGSECGGDPKQWLFRKMMMGRDQQQGTGSSRPGTNDGGGGGVRGGRVEEDDEAGDDADHEDMASEAGTYVVDKQPPSAMTSSQMSGATTVTTRRGVESDSCSTSSSSSSTASPGPQPPVRPSFQASAGPKRSLMSDLRRLREIGGGNDGQKQPVQQPKKTVPMPMAQAAAAVPPKLPPPIPAQRKLQPQTVTTTSANANLPTSTAGGQQPSNRPCRANANVGPQQQQAFRPSSASSSSTRCRSEPRTDGGRFSMRPTAHRPLPALQAGNGGSGGRGPVPMRQQSANASGANKQPVMLQKSPEMLNWLRRKEYDPRKAAVTTAVTTAVEQPQQPVKVVHQQQQHQLRAQEAFMANRSLSAAVPSSIVSGSATITKQQPSSAFSRWRSAQQGYGGGGEGGRAASLNRSHDDLSSRMGESLDEESLLGGQDSCTGSLQRTVDELTQKCHKSITLLKLCNQSALSPSVEQLLERVIRSGGEGAAFASDMPSNSSSQPRTQLAQAEGGENISDRLERLSSAFDAIQKYLEEQTSIGTRTMGGNGGTFRKSSTNGNSGTSQSQAKLLDKSAMLGNNFAEQKKPGEN